MRRLPLGDRLASSGAPGTVCRIRHEHDLALVESQYPEDRLEALSVEREAAQIHPTLRRGSHRLGVVKRTIRPNPQQDGLTLVGSGFIGEADLGPPAVEDLIELVVSLIDLLANSERGSVECLSIVSPLQHQDPPEFESLCLFVHFGDFAQAEADLHRDRSVAFR